LVRVLKERGHTVIGLDIGYFRECLDNGATLADPDVMIVRDIRDTAAEDLEGVEGIIHLSAISNDPMGQLRPRLTEDINFKATIRLATMAKEAGIERFVMASSCSIYGAAHNSTEALDETAPFNPVSAYAISKVRSEETIASMADDRFSPVFMRNATAFGVSPRMRFDLVLPNLMAWAKTSGVVKVMSDGTPWRPLVHIEDISLAAACAVEAPRSAVHGQAFNIGRNDANYQIRDIAEAVSAAAGNVSLEITGEAGGDSRSYRVNFMKAAEKLPGFNPRWTLEKGCEELTEWFDRNPGLTPEITQQRRFVRLAQLQHLIDSHRVDDELRVVGPPL
jgi:nucleoside-diphosphate-sugar epimerase